MEALSPHLKPAVQSSGAANRQTEILYQLPLYDVDIESIHQMYSLLLFDQQEVFRQTYIPFKALQTYKAMVGDVDFEINSKINTAIDKIQSELDKLNQWKNQACGIGEIKKYNQHACTVRLTSIQLIETK